MNTIANETIAIVGPKGIPKDFPGTSGVEAYVENQISLLIKQGNVIHCYTRRWSSRGHFTTYKGATIIALPTINTTFFDTISYSFLASIHASFSKATIVWYHGIGPAFFSFIPKLFHKRVYTTVHSLDWDRKKWNVLGQLFLRLCERVTLSLSDKIFVVSTRLETYYQERYRKNTVVDKYTIVKRPKIPADIIRRKYHLVKNGYILYLGRFVPEKRIEWLIRAGMKNPNINIVLAGGSSHSVAYVRHLKTLAHDKNVLFTGYVFGKEKAELLSNCRLVVLPSMLEGYPISIAEALAYGKRCLIGDFLTSEYPSNNKLIYYFKRDSYENFVKKLNGLLHTRG
jgi:glycosyltransferase involved in cell wall biosynthesis